MRPRGLEACRAEVKGLGACEACCSLGWRLGAWRGLERLGRARGLKA